MLFDPQFSAYRKNIIALLGAIGNPDTIPLLASIIGAKVSPDQADADIGARLAAPLAIGAIASRYKVPENEIAILRSASNQAFWEERLSPAKTE